MSNLCALNRAKPVSHTLDVLRPNSPLSRDILPAPPKIINVARIERHGYARAFLLELGNNDGLASLMGQLKARLGADRLKAFIKKAVQFQEEAIFEAAVQSTIARALPDIEAGAAFLDLGPLTYCPLLTEAYRNPKGLGDLVDVHGLFRKYVRNPRGPENMVLIVGWKTRRTYMFICLGALCATSLLIGVVVGLTCHDASLGASIGGGLFALLGVVVALLVVLTK